MVNKSRVRAAAVVVAGGLAVTACSSHGTTTAVRPAATFRAGTATLDLRTAEAVAQSEHVTVQRAVWLLRRQNTLAAKDQRLRSRTSRKMLGGSWIDQTSGKLVAAVTKDGTTPKDPDIENKTVLRSLIDLDQVKSKVDLAARQDRPKDAGWFVDEPHNIVSVNVPRSEMKDPGTVKFVKDVRDLGPAVRLITISAAPRQQVGIKDGDELTSLALSSCTMGWWVKDRSGADLLMTAGHCMEHDGGAWHFQGLRIGGDVTHQNAPHDWGLTHVDAISTPRPTTQVNLYDGTTAKISKPGRAAIGSLICKSGATSHRTCGKLISYGVTLTIGGVTVTDLAQASYCGQAGDSGGPVYQDDPDKPGHVIALGIHKAGPDVCGSNRSTYFTPIDIALSDSNTQLIVSTD